MDNSRFSVELTSCGKNKIAICKILCNRVGYSLKESLELIMRTDNINITMKMPLPVNNPDRNGVMYSKEAFKKAFEDVNGRPLEVLLNNGNRTSIGVIQDITYVEDEFGDYALVNGRIMYGGTCEYIQDLEKVSGVITSMTLASVGIGD